MVTQTDKPPDSGGGLPMSRTRRSLACESRFTEDFDQHGNGLDIRMDLMSSDLEPYTAVIEPNGADHRHSTSSKPSSSRTIVPDPDIGHPASNGEASEKRPDIGVTSGRPWYHPISLLLLAVKNWFLFGMGIAIGLAYRFPQVAASGGCKSKGLS